MGFVEGATCIAVYSIRMTVQGVAEMWQGLEPEPSESLRGNLAVLRLASRDLCHSLSGGGDG